ncbi:MAG TPA: ABC transporter ATP-binding protein [Aestuariivirgaceae bacterium]|nr:ABC transporter ATP-binding protein [Aestuariivirgaceae bacterium]
MSDVVLETQALAKHFDGVVAAQDVSVSVSEGERVGIIGANGAGKTTFVNMVTGYLKPESGRISYRGDDITALQPRDITRLGIRRSFQIPQLFPGLTVLENLLVARTITLSPRLGAWRDLRTDENLAAIEDILRRYRLEDYRHHVVATLAQGVRKLLDIAMTTVGDPALVLLDEPTSGISMDEKFAIMDIVMGALDTIRTTVLFIEHDMEVVERYAPRVIAFYDGRVIADAPTAEALGDPDVRQYVIGRELHRNE